MKNIVVGIDRSTTAANALDWSADLAEASDAALHVMHTWRVPALAYGPEPYWPQVSSKELQRAAESYVAAEIEESGLTDVTTLVVEGSARQALSDAAGPETLVVVGRTGRGLTAAVSRLADGVLGSTARAVVHDADGPVAVVPPTCTWSAAPRVLVAVDGGPASLAALDWAMRNLPTDAKIEAVHYVIPWLHDDLVSVDTTYRPAIIANGETELTDWISELRSRGAGDRSVDVRVEVGAASWALSHESRDVDLVVVGHRNRSALAHRLLGSVTDHIIRHSHAPAIVVPEPVA